MLLIAVTKVDDVTNEEYSKASARLVGSKPRKREIYDELVERFKDQMRRQVADQLGAIGSSTNDAVSQAREAARNRILGSLDIHPVSAPEYRRILREDEDDRPFLTSTAATGVPSG